MYLQAIVIFSLSIVQPFLCHEGVEASDDPILEYLGMESDSVSEHELVEIDLSERLHKRGLRDGKPMSFQAFGNKISLWLLPADPTFVSSNTLVYYAQFEEGQRPEVQYHFLPHAMNNIGGILQDREHMASVILDSDDSGKTTVTAHLRSPKDNSRLTIRPLPANVIREYMRKKRSIDDLNDDFIDSTYHVVLKLSDDKFKDHTMDALESGQAEMSWDEHYEKASNYENINYQKRVTTLYPEIVVYTDHSFAFNWSNRTELNRALKYMLVFWNSVNLVYRQVETPKIKLHIGAIIFGMHPKTTPFIANNPLGDNGFHSERALDSSVFFFNQTAKWFPFSNYDLVVTMSKRPMGPTIKFSHLGIAFTGGACGYFSSALVRDYGGFSSIAVAAHELGHLFSLRHDKEPKPSVCTGTNGYIMAATAISTQYKYTFSPCSLDALAANFTLARFRCMENVPNFAQPQVPIKLPGQLRSLAEQCAAEPGAGEPCNVNRKVDICAHKYCMLANSSSIICQAYRAPLPGTPCIKKEDGKNGMCVDFRCVSD